MRYYRRRQLLWPTSVPYFFASGGDRLVNRSEHSDRLPTGPHALSFFILYLNSERKKLDSKYAIANGLPQLPNSGGRHLAHPRQIRYNSRSQALPGNALPARLCLAYEPGDVGPLSGKCLRREAEPRMQCVPRQSLGTRKIPWNRHLLLPFPKAYGTSSAPSNAKRSSSMIWSSPLSIRKNPGACSTSRRAPCLCPG